MKILHLGVINIPYVQHAPEPKKAPKNPKRAAKKPPPKPPGNSGATITTGQVAQILEERYGILGTFAANFGPQIKNALAHSVQEQVEAIMAGLPVGPNPYAEAEGEITEGMKEFLSGQFMDGMAAIDGSGHPIPTAAALAGKSHRFKGKKKDGPRPSFIDTGLMMASYKAWVE